MPYDLLIKNGTVVDGSGLPRYRADVAVRHGRIAAVGRIREGAREVVDADGLVVIVLRGGTPTGALPGRLLRGPRPWRA